MAFKFVSSNWLEIKGRPVLRTDILQDPLTADSLVVERAFGQEDASVQFKSKGELRPKSPPVIVRDSGSLKDIVSQAGFDISGLKEEAILLTHTPPFHADDLVATALMLNFFHSQGRPVTLVWSRDPEVISKADAVVDVGGVYDPKGLRFDHHQDRNAAKAATGLVADFLQSHGGYGWISQFQEAFNKIDSVDLGKSAPAPLGSKVLGVSQVLAMFNPTWEELALEDSQKDSGASKKNQPPLGFFAALSQVQVGLYVARASRGFEPEKSASEVFEQLMTTDPVVMTRMASVEAAVAKGKETFLQGAREALGSSQSSPKGIVYTQRGIDFADLFSETYLEKSTPENRAAIKSVNYIAIPTAEGGFSAIAAPTAKDPMKQKHPFPESWRGKRGQELVDEISKSLGVETKPVDSKMASHYFCHFAGFFLTLPEEGLFSKALNYCASKALEKEGQGQEPPKKPKDKALKSAELWGRGGPM